ncbi:MAG: M56 family metallopeptidase [Bacteroidota bacterium]
MMEIIPFFSWLGELSISYFWAPVGVWTLGAFPLFMIAKKLGRRRPVIQYLATTALLISLPLGFVMMPMLEDGLTNITVNRQVSSLLIEPVDNIGMTIPAYMEAPVIKSIPSKANVPAQPAPINGNTIVGIITTFFAVVSVYGLLTLSAKLFCLRVMRLELRPVEDASALTALRHIKELQGIKRSIRLMYSPRGMAPATFGFWRPIIIIPEEIINEPETLKPTLYHELIHVRRNDYFNGIITRFIRALYVYHPFVLFLENQSKTFRELSCDNEILNQSVMPPGDYARLLMRFSSGSAAPHTVSMIAPKSILKQRIKVMSDFVADHKQLHRSIRQLVMPALLLIPVFVMSCELEEDYLRPHEYGVVAEGKVSKINELGLSLEIPDRWEKIKVSRRTQGDRLDNYPESIQYILEDGIEQPDKLTSAEYVYRYSNVTFPESFADIKHPDDFRPENWFHYFLTIRVAYSFSYSRQRDKLEACSATPSCTGLSTYYNNLEFNQLSLSEIPFDADAGFRSTSQDPGQVDPPNTVFNFFSDRNKKSYWIKFSGSTIDPEKREEIEAEVLNEILPTIQFLDI